MRLLLILFVIGLVVVGCDSGRETPTPTETPTVTPTSTVLPTETPTPPSNTPTPTSEPTQVVTPTTARSQILDMVSITGGTFSMGSYSGGSAERQVHTVTLSPFSMSAYEVTYSQWLEVKKWAENNNYIYNKPGEMGSKDYGNEQDANHPVTDIEWYDAVLWCNASSEMEGRTPCYYTSVDKSVVYRSGRTDIQNDWVNWEADGYRLPTETEWEYAARGGLEGKTYPWGDNSPVCIAGAFNGAKFDDDDKCNFINTFYDDGTDDGNSNIIGTIGTVQVGTYAPNGFGLYDVAGNVWEWCWDWFYSGYYKDSPSNSPLGPSTGWYRVIRGGSWDFDAERLQCHYRLQGRPHGGLGGRFGFRPVCSQ